MRIYRFSLRRSLVIGAYGDFVLAGHASRHRYSHPGREKQWTTKME